ncbi:carbohydrate-binding protein, partial [Sphaerisporangium rufum]|uniref:carbohydrate-binding protein n=1 Tax=Sphaerisporangium rufum TaxID=1381558 RepID=UPI00195205ED
LNALNAAPPNPTPTPTPTGPNPTPTPTPTGPGSHDGWSRIEAESYDSSSGTLQVCDSSIICYIGAGAAAQYNAVDLHGRTDGGVLSVANGGSSSSIQVWVGDTNVGTIDVPNTGGWDTYQTRTFSLSPQSGVQNVRLVFPSGNLNLDWFSFTGTLPTPTPTPSPSVPGGRDGWSAIEAEGYDSSGGTLQACDGRIICYIGANAWTQYNGVDLHDGTNSVQLQVANGGGNSSVQVWVGGTNVGTLTVGGTGGWDTYQTRSLTLPAQSGVKDVRLVFVNGNLNVDWIKFSA